jgi:hypothetical protein
LQAFGNVYREGALEIEHPTVAPKFFTPLRVFQMDEPCTSERGGDPAQSVRDGGS